MDTFTEILKDLFYHNIPILSEYYNNGLMKRIKKLNLITYKSRNNGKTIQKNSRTHDSSAIKSKWL